jgi:hypothetical protein
MYDFLRFFSVFKVSLSLVLAAKVNQTRNFASQFLAMHNHIDKTVLKQEFGPLKTLRQLNFNRLKNGPGTGKAYQSARLGNYYIAQHRETCCNAASSRVSQD